MIIRLLISALLGGALIIFGVLIGATSHQATYKTVNQETVAHFLSDDSSSSDKRGFLQFEKDSNFYLINESDFTPKVDGNSFGDGDVISFIYRTDSQTNIDVKASNTSTHLVGDAYTIEQISVPGSNGQASKVYTSSEYSQNPKGFYQNNWPIGAGVIVLGLIVAALAFFLPMLRNRNRNKVQSDSSIASPPNMGIPFGAQPPWNAYNQVPNQYQQNPQQFQRPAFTPPPGQFNTPPQYPPKPSQFNPPGYPQQPGQFNMPVQYPQQGGSYEPTQRADPPRN